MMGWGCWKKNGEKGSGLWLGCGWAVAGRGTVWGRGGACQRTALSEWKKESMAATSASKLRSVEGSPQSRAIWFTCGSEGYTAPWVHRMRQSHRHHINHQSPLEWLLSLTSAGQAESEWDHGYGAQIMARHLCEMKVPMLLSGGAEASENEQPGGWDALLDGGQRKRGACTQARSERGDMRRDRRAEERIAALRNVLHGVEESVHG